MISIRSSQVLNKQKIEPANDMFHNQECSDIKSIHDINNDNFVDALDPNDKSLEFLLERLKFDSKNLQLLSTFIKKRSFIEEEYGKALSKLTHSFHEQVKPQNEVLNSSKGVKEIWKCLLLAAEDTGKSRISLGKSLITIAEELSIACKNAERSKKQIKDAGSKYKKNISDAEGSLLKAITKYELANVELEKFRSKLTSVPGNQNSNSMGYLFGKKKSEEDLWICVQTAKQDQEDAGQIEFELRQQYYVQHLPNLMNCAKEADEECGLAISAMLIKYLESLQRNAEMDFKIVGNRENPSKLGESIGNFDASKDFQECLVAFSANEVIEQKSVLRPPFIEVRSFGVDLIELSLRDGKDIPIVVSKCISYVEKFGIHEPGLYRISASVSSVREIKKALEVNTFSDTNVYDIHAVCGALKQFFRELPVCLFTENIYTDFLEAAKISSTKKRLLEIHHLVNRLPDPYYATLRCIMGHLIKVASLKSQNMMDISNLSVIFAPALIFSKSKESNMDEPKLAVIVLSTVLEGYDEIFD